MSATQQIPTTPVTGAGPEKPKPGRFADWPPPPPHVPDPGTPPAS